MKNKILVLIPLPKVTLDVLENFYELLYAPNPIHQEALFIEKQLIEAKAVITNGSRGMSAEEMKLFPNLQIICIYGAGYENLDILYAHQMNIKTTYAPGANDETVADVIGGKQTIGELRAKAQDPSKFNADELHNDPAITGLNPKIEGTNETAHDLYTRLIGEGYKDDSICS